MLFGNDNAGIILDNSGKYRYSLWRLWDRRKPIVCWILLNPSTADELKLDPTLIRCKRYSEDWGFGGFRVVNVFGLRSLNSKVLFNNIDPVGNDNDTIIRKECMCVSKIVVGWGNNVLRFKDRFKDRFRELSELLYYEELYALKLTKRYQPAHPLYLRRDVKPFLYKKEGQSLLEVCKIK